MENYLRTFFPGNNHYSGEDWYLQLKKRKDRFQKRLFRSIILGAAFIPWIVILAGLIFNKAAHLYANIFISLLFFSGYLLSGRISSRLFYRISICIIYFLVLASALWALIPLYLITIVVFPILGIQLFGRREGLFLSLLFPASQVVVTLFFNKSTFIAQNPEYLVFCLIAYTLVLILNLVIEKHHSRNLEHLINNILIDKVTMLPAQKVLKSHCSALENGLFAIIKIANFAELGLIFGYELSDTVLIHVARFLQELGISMNFTVYRLRGNEFGILKPLGPEHSTEVASSFLLSLNRKMENLIINWKESHLTLYIVLGGTMVHKGNQEYLSQADLAVKEGMETHVPVVLYTEESTVKDNVLNNLSLYSVLKDNLDESSLQAYYQPIIDSSTHEVIWYETLLRVKEKDGVMSSPIPYLTVAESTGLDRHISDFVLEEACKALTLLKTHISVNVSLNDLKRPDFLDKLVAFFPKDDKGEGTLILEILERQELHTLDKCQKFLLKARELGCLIAIDDFGSGYSNYSNLLDFPVDIIKIDGALVQQIHKNPRAEVLVNNIVEFSKKLNLKVVAEYVDTKDIADTLRLAGVDFLQGWFFGKAEPLNVHFNRVCETL